MDGVEYTLSSKGQTVGPYTLVDLDMKDGIVTFSREEKTCAFKLRAGSVTQLEAQPVSPAMALPFKTDKVILTKQVKETPQMVKAVALFLQTLDTNPSIPPEERVALKRKLSDPQAKLTIMGSAGLSQSDATAAFPLTAKQVETANEMQQLGEEGFWW